MEIGLVSEWGDDVGIVDVKDLIDLMIYKKDLRRMRLAPHGLGRRHGAACVSIMTNISGRVARRGCSRIAFGECRPSVQMPCLGAVAERFQWLIVCYCRLVVAAWCPALWRCQASGVSVSPESSLISSSRMESKEFSSPSSTESRLRDASRLP